jgi:hypothetical protein
MISNILKFGNDAASAIDPGCYEGVQPGQGIV